MGGFFAVASKSSCVDDLFYGTDYHSHLGTKRGGMAVVNQSGIKRFIHDISTAQFRSKFQDDRKHLDGRMGIGVISDYEDQPLIIGSHHGTYAIATVGKINNIAELAKKTFKLRTTHFSEMSGGEINPTELVATLINHEATIVEGIASAMDLIDGSCSMLILTSEGIYAARDKLGRTPIVIGAKKDSIAATFETTAFPNRGFKTERFLGPGEIVFFDADGVERKKAPGKRMQICSFLWVYYGYPSSDYEGINVEKVRNCCGHCLADNDNVKVDIVAGIPDSGTGHGLGYANRAKIPYCRAFVKYTPTWPRSFMPQEQEQRDLVAMMKLIPVGELIKDRKILFCEDSIVRGTQLRDTIQRLYEYGAKEIHMRPACPPLVFGCKFLNFSRSKSVLDLAARRAILKIEGSDTDDFSEYVSQKGEKYRKMIDIIRKELNLTSLKYQKLSDLVKAIGLPKEKLCTYCWDGKE